MTKTIFLNGYDILPDGTILGCSPENYKKKELEQYKEITKDLIKMILHIDKEMEKFIVKLKK
jgi:hypothetical protein